VHGMQTRGMAKAATVVVVRQTVKSSPKQHYLQQKVSCWMHKAQDPTELSTPPCEVENGYSSDSSSPSLKQVFQSKTKVEAKSSKTIVMPLMTIGTKNLEEEIATMKTILERLIKDSEEKEKRRGIKL